MVKPAINVLLVDDDEDYFLIINKLLERCDDAYQLDWEPVFENASSQLSEKKHDVCLLDYHLSSEQRSGFELFEYAKESGIEMPVILLTSRQDKLIEDNAIKSGIADFLKKEKIDADSLDRSIRYAIERQKSQTQVNKMMSRYDLLLNSIGDGIIELDYDGIITFINSSGADQLSATKQDIVGASLFQLLDTHHIGSISQHPIFSACLRGNIYKESEAMFKKADGTQLPVEYTSTPILDDKFNTESVAIVFQDITERKENEEKLVHLAEHDVLTGLANRALFYKTLPQMLAQAQRHNHKVVLLFLDLDGFKTINDSLGHDLGDQLLKQVSERLLQSVRKSDVIVRFGGDEFIVILEGDLNSRQVVNVAQKILESLKESFSLKQYELSITTSIGIASYPDCASEIGMLVKCADAAMYMAKRQGGNNYQFYTVELNKEINDRLIIENYLRKAVQRNEFELYYQPIYDLGDQSLVGAEALIRWHSSALGELSPDKFIPIAEELAIIDTIGEWVLREGCRQLKEWKELGLKVPRLSINLSVRQLYLAEIDILIAEVLKETGVDPTCIEIEITETSMMSNWEQLIPIFQRLRQMGITVAVDDFGTGYSSLSILKALPIDTLKIDTCFVKDITKDKVSATIVKSVIELATSLELDVIAEGIETDEQHQFLLDSHCPHGQGFLFNKPLTAKQFMSLLYPKDMVLRACR